MNLRRTRNCLAARAWLILLSHGLRLSLILERTNSCPPQERAASTRSIATNANGFVEASASRVLRDGEGTFLFTLHCRRMKSFVKLRLGVYSTRIVVRRFLSSSNGRKKLSSVTPGACLKRPVFRRVPWVERKRVPQSTGRWISW